MRAPRPVANGQVTANPDMVDELKQLFDMITGLTLYLPVLVAAAQRSRKSEQDVAHSRRGGTGGTAPHEQV
jgi:hypothetical protein